MFLRTARHLVVLIAAAAMWRCGSSPTSPSGGVKLQGVVVQDATATSASAGVSARSAAKAGKIVVTVQENPSLSVTVSGNGTFEIQGLPAGGFTLVFSVNGATVGQITITAVAEGTTIKIVVRVSDQEVELVDMETDDDTGSGNGDQGTKICMIEGGKPGAGIELEGNVDSGTSSQFKLRVNGNRSSGLVDVAAAGASYKCNGNKGGSDCKSNLKTGSKVHVGGNLTSCTTSAASVTATEVMIQKD
ncbi:MAG: hypothetical protein DMF81_23150 [Acidobacteria bacterium]|nr:MAG: hypothetical protein DMF81_23150 [Acidobacteriota bacterium]